jgi:hypothetical protein
MVSPALYTFQSQSHPIRRLCCNGTTSNRHLILIRHLHLKRTHKRSYQRLQLAPREFLSNATPRPMQKRQVAIVAPHPASIICLPRAGVNPALGDELCCLVSPEERRAIDGPRRDVNFGAFRDLLGEDCGFSDGDAHGDGDSWVKAEDFVADCSEVGE